MNPTKLAGWILLVMTVAYAGVTIMSFGPKYAAAGYIGEKAEHFGLQSNTTNLRFQMGSELVVDIICIGILAIAGWWLTTQEVTQIAWVIIVGLFAVFSVVIRSTPVMPLSALKLSPGAAFYGAQVQAVVTANPSQRYVVISRSQNMRAAMVGDAQGKGADVLVLDLRNRTGSTKFMACSAYPVTITGTIAGTSGIATGKTSRNVALLHVRDAYQGLPQKK